MNETDLADLDRTIEAIYAAAFRHDWCDYRALALRRLSEWSGAESAVWLMRCPDGGVVHMTAWPDASGAEDVPAWFDRIVAGGGDHDGEREPSAAVDPGEGRWAWSMRTVHRNSTMTSVVCLSFPLDYSPRRDQLRHGVGHVVQAGMLSLARLIERDDWLMSMGRASRGSAALVDRNGCLYMASDTFRASIHAAFGVSGDLSHLPFTLPPSALEGEGGFFDIGDLHFRLVVEGGLYLLHARQPHPLDALSPREQEIARALASGKTFKSVARECDIAISTVANHASRIYRKLGIYRREELVGLLRAAVQPQGIAA